MNSLRVTRWPPKTKDPPISTTSRDAYSIELFASIEALPDQARAVYACAQALDAAGRKAESRTRLAEATTMFADLGIAPDATVA